MGTEEIERNWDFESYSVDNNSLLWRMVCGWERKDTTLQHGDIKFYSKYLANSMHIIPPPGFAW